MFRRWLFTHTSFVGDPAATLARVETDLATVVREALGLPPDQPAADGSFPLQADGPQGRHATLEAVLGPAVRDGVRLRAPLRWSASSPPGASFDGALEVEPVGEARVELSVHGQYAAAEGAPEPRSMLELTEAAGRRLLRALASALGEQAAAAARLRAPRLRVRDLMTANPVVLGEDTPLRTAALVLLHRGVGGAPVVDGNGRLVGVLTETDLLIREAAPREREGPRGRDEARRRRAAVAGEACSRPPLTAHPDTSAREAARQLYDEDVSRLVVVEDGRIVGILTRRDVLRALTRTHEELESAVAAALAAVGADDLRADVRATGQVVLGGHTRWHTAAQEAVRAVAAVDGVTEVVDELGWSTDDAARRRRDWTVPEGVG